MLGRRDHRSRADSDRAGHGPARADRLRSLVRGCPCDPIQAAGSVICPRAVADGVAVGDDSALDPGRSRSRPACPDQVDA